MYMSKFGDTDKDYWNHARTDVKWNAHCRISHGQPTWYYSFMGRRDKMIEWRKLHTDTKRDQHREESMVEMFEQL
jgi:hypothetical protein